MTIDEIRRQGAQLGWTHEQMLFMQDIVRNALVPLSSREPTPQRDIETACAKLLTMTETVEDCVADGARRPDPRAQTVCIACGTLPCVCGSGGALTQELEAAARESTG